MFFSGDEIHYGSGKVLVIDDEDIVRDSLKDILEYLGYSVEVAGTGDEAMTLYRGRRDEGRQFDVVLVDLIFPNRDRGEDIRKKIHEIDPGLPIVAISGYLHDSVFEEYQQYGFRASVAKPISIKTLSKVLKTALSS